MEVDEGYIFTSKDTSGLHFEYSGSEDYEDEIIHNGSVVYDGVEYYGSITCDENGIFSFAQFCIYEMEDGSYEEVANLYDDNSELSESFDTFFKDEVCPYLTYSF